MTTTLRRKYSFNRAKRRRRLRKNRRCAQTKMFEPLESRLLLSGIIEGTVFLDLGANGIHDPLESGINQVIVHLLEAGNQQTVDTTATNASGLYQFGNVATGDYIVRFELSANHAFSALHAMLNGASVPTLDSDADPATGNTQTITLADNQTVQLDAGMFDPRPAIDNLLPVDVLQGDPLNLATFFRDIDDFAGFEIEIDWDDGDIDTFVSGDTGITDPIAPTTGNLSATVDFQFDDAGSMFFNTQQKQDLMQYAASVTAGLFSDTLEAITPSGGNSWDADFENPDNNQSTSLANLQIDENKFTVFVGADDLGGSLAIGGPGGFRVRGTQTFVDTVVSRGQTGVGQTDFNLWGGGISFNTTADWYFDINPTGQGVNENDFLSVAFHEMFHVLGFGTSNSFNNLIVANAFTGQQSMLLYDDNPGNPVPLAGGGPHWANNLTDQGQEVAMDPDLIVGDRKLPTELDVAALDDLGWDLITSSIDGSINAQHQFFQTGPKTVTVTVRDDDGNESSSAQQVNVQPAQTTAQILGSKFNDLNGDGIQDAGELPVQGVTIELIDTSTGQVILTTTTDINGQFLFANLAPGKYDVREVLSAGFVQTTVVGGLGFDRISEINNIAPLSGNPQTIVTGDFDGDGDIDFIGTSLLDQNAPVPNQDETELSLHIARGDGTFLSSLTLDVDGQLQKLAAGDLNGDGIDDLAGIVVFRDPISGLMTSRQLVSLISMGNGDFRQQDSIELVTTDNPRALAIGDADNDGDNEVFYLEQTAAFTGQLNVFKNDGEGNLSTGDTDIIADGDPLVMVIADIDNDNLLDVIVGGTNFTVQNANTGFVRTFENRSSGAGNINYRPDFVSEQGNSVRHIAVGKTDGDTLPDIVLHERPVTVSLGVIDQSTTRLLTNLGSINFQVGNEITLDIVVDDFAGGDLNNDGLLDLITVDNDGTGVVSVFAGDGAGGFDDPFEHDLNNEARSLAVGNLDIDMDDDVIIGGPSMATVLIHQPPLHVTLVEGQVVSNLIFGNQQNPTSSIAGRKFVDDNGNGVLDNAEPGLNGVTIELVDAITGQTIDTQVTHTIDNEDGHYSFDNVPQGAYDVRELGITDYVPSISPDFGLGFADPTRFDLGNLTNVLQLAADIDGDGDAELITTSQDIVNVVTTIIINVNRGDGVMIGNRSVVLSGLIEHLAATDLNGDGSADLIAVIQLADGSRKVSTLISDSLGSFIEKSSVALDATFTPIALAANNVKVAVVGTDNGSGHAIVFNNDGAGVLTLFRTDDLGAVIPASVEFADFDNDGDQDIVMAGQTNAGAGFVRVLRRSSNGSLSLLSQVNIDLPVVDIAVRDFVPGGALEYALHLLPNEQNATSILRVTNNSGNALHDDIDSGFLIVDMSAGDFNADGAPDIATIDIEEQNGGIHTGIISVFLNNGAGQLQPSKERDLDINTQALVAVDLDGNGADDLLLVGVDESANDEHVALTLITSDHRRILLPADTQINQVNFGNQRIPLSNIQGTKFVDLNSNGQQDPNEAGLNGITFELVERLTGEIIDSQVTQIIDGDYGQYRFENVPIGDYFVREVITDARLATSPLDPLNRLYAAAERIEGATIINELFRIDPITGAFMLIGQLNAKTVTGLAHLNDGRLVGSATIDAGSRVLININPITAATSVIGVLPVAMRDLAYDQNTDTLYGHGSDDKLYTIDSSTAASAVIGSSNFSGTGRGLAINLAGDLFAAPGTNFLSVDTSDGTGTLLGNTDADIKAMDFQPGTGVLFGALNPTGPGTDSLVTLNTANGQIAFIGPTIADIDALAFVSNIAGLIEISITTSTDINLDSVGNAALVDVQINQGLAAVNGPTQFDVQRSQLANFVITFDRQMIVDAGDIQLIALGMNPGVDQEQQIDLTQAGLEVSSNGDSTFDLSINLLNQTLSDGIYELRLKSTLTDASGVGLHDSLDFIFRTHQLQGDFDGDGDFDGSAAERATLQHWFLQFSDVPSFVDANGSGGFNILDFSFYIQNFGTTLNVVNPDGFEPGAAQASSSSTNNATSNLTQLLSSPVTVTQVQVNAAALWQPRTSTHSTIPIATSGYSLKAILDADEESQDTYILTTDLLDTPDLN